MIRMVARKPKQKSWPRTEFVFTMGLSEVALPVKDVKASVRFYTDVVGLTLETGVGKDGAFLWAGADQQQRVILLDKARLQARHSKSPFFKKEGSILEQAHFAFRVPPEKLVAAVDHVRQRGVSVSEPVHFDIPGSMKATAYYFYDPDGNLLEFWSPDPA